MFHFYNPCKCQKTIGFPMLTGCIEMEHWYEIVMFQHKCFMKTWERIQRRIQNPVLHLRCSVMRK